MVVQDNICSDLCDNLASHYRGEKAYSLSLHSVDTWMSSEKMGVLAHKLTLNSFFLIVYRLRRQICLPQLFISKTVAILNLPNKGISQCTAKTIQTEHQR